MKNVPMNHYFIVDPETNETVFISVEDCSFDEHNFFEMTDAHGIKVTHHNDFATMHFEYEMLQLCRDPVADAIDEWLFSDCYDHADLQGVGIGAQYA